MICASCGTQNEAGRRFCDECGAGLAAACPTCGEANRPSAKFCGNCGTVLTGDANAAAPAAPVGRTSYGPTTAAERRFVSVLFVDLVGFTPFAEERDAEQYARRSIATSASRGWRWSATAGRSRSSSATP